MLLQVRCGVSLCSCCSHVVQTEGQASLMNWVKAIQQCNGGHVHKVGVVS